VHKWYQKATDYSSWCWLRKNIFWGEVQLTASQSGIILNIGVHSWRRKSAHVKLATGSAACIREEGIQMARQGTCYMFSRSKQLMSTVGSFWPACQSTAMTLMCLILTSFQSLSQTVCDGRCVWGCVPFEEGWGRQKQVMEALAAIFGHTKLVAFPSIIHFLVIGLVSHLRHTWRTSMLLCLVVLSDSTG